MTDDHPSEHPGTAEVPADDTPSPEGGDSISRTVTIPPDIQMVTLLGPRDELLRTMERAFPRVELHVRGNEFRAQGPSADVAIVEELLGELLTIIDAGHPLNRDAVERSIGMLQAKTRERPADVLTMNIVSSRGRTIRPKTLGQKQYVDAIDSNTVVFGIGPAGTGKTYLAMAKAVAALQAKEVNRIILTRPAVEAGERLGFLPGTLNDKIDPYLRPLYDALHDMIDPDSIPRLMAAGTIEVAPLAYMRGRAQPLDAKVLTPEGFREIGSLAVGDLVIGSDGSPTPVLGVFPQGRKPIFRVSAQDGSSTLCCGEHLWTVRTASDKRRGTQRTLQTQDMIGHERAAHAHRFELPVVAPVNLPEADVPLDPHVLGLLLGDGSRATLANPVAAAAVVNASAGGSLDPSPAPGDAPDRVPQAYLLNSLSVRHALLQGLLDSEAGHVRGEAGTTSIEVRSGSAGLRDDVVELVRSLGGVADTGSDHDAYVVDLRLPAGLEPFRLERKRVKYAQGEPGRPMRFVHAIEPAGEAETVCIQVAAADSLYVTDDFLVTHNTLNDSFIILDEAQNTSAEQMKMFLTRLGFGSRMVVTGDTTQVDLPSGTTSGLRVVQQILGDVDDVHFAHLKAQDVVRHRLVSEIVEAYGRWDAKQEKGAPGQHGQRGPQGPSGRRPQGER